MATKSISELRKARGNFESLTKEIEKSNKGGYEKKEDDRMWQCKTDTAGNGTAVIRFLPAPQGEEFPYVRMWAHGFKGPTGKWYIENSRTTLGKDEKDPVSELNNQLWATKLKENEEIARIQKRKLSFYSNVLIISDPANPENEGKVKIFRYGKKIFDILESAMKPEFEDDEAFNPFDFWDGANFRLKIVRKDGYANFDKSSLADPKPVSSDDDELQKLWDQCHSLKEIVSEDKFKSYDELVKRLNSALATSAPTQKAENTDLDEDDEAFMRASSKSKAKKEAEAEDKEPEVEEEKPKKTTKAKPVAQSVDDSEDDDLEYFKSLAGD